LLSWPSLQKTPSLKCRQEAAMNTPKATTGAARRLGLMDTVLSLVAGSAMIFISITFLLWLRC
jgi:hypothetical protein